MQIDSVYGTTHTHLKSIFGKSSEIMSSEVMSGEIICMLYCFHDIQIYTNV